MINYIIKWTLLSDKKLIYKTLLYVEKSSKYENNILFS